MNEYCNHQKMAFKVLTALDHARTQYYHFRAIVIAGMGLFTDAYDLFSITTVMKLIGRVYYPAQDGKPDAISPAAASTVVGIALVGTVFGQLVFGMLGDRMGRRKVYGLSLLMMVLSAIASGFSICRTRKCMFASLCFFRFWLGVGIGGDYPLSATIMSEFANKQTRGSFIAAVFSMQGFGILASSAVTMVLASVFQLATNEPHSRPSHGESLNKPDAVDLLWRIILMAGAIPAAVTFYWRMGMPETARFTALVENDVNKANSDIARVLGDPDLNTIPEESETIYCRPPKTYGIFSKQFLKNHGRNLFACSMAWLIVDIPFYSNTLLQSKIYHPAEDVNAYQEAINIAKFQAVFAAASTIPGYWATVYFIDRVGRRKIQMMGFFFMAVFLFCLAGPYDRYWYHHTNGWFMALYGLTFFFSNFGPNTTTFIVPAELFPARFRSTCHGISGAAGKVGAIVGSVGFLWASQDKDKRHVEEGRKPGRLGMMNVWIILGGVCVVGMVLTYFITPETMGRSLEENEEREGRDSESYGHFNGVVA